MTGMWENVLLALNGLRSNKMRALLTMLGIIIGIGSVIGIMHGGRARLTGSDHRRDVLPGRQTTSPSPCSSA